jgi:predicted RNA binding protein YcfA (HicA-like mRNA interferase family)
MAKLRVLSGAEVLRILGGFGFRTHSQRGSHVKLRRESSESLTVPFHPELDRGTLQAIYRQALRFIPEKQLRPHFYTD